MISMNAEAFEKHVMQGSTPVLVEYWAPWCGYCRRIIPAMKKIAEQNAGTLLVGQINIDEEPVLAREAGVEVIPTLILYRDGELLDSIVAPESKARIEEFLRVNLEGHL